MGVYVVVGLAFLGWVVAYVYASRRYARETREYWAKQDRTTPRP